MKRQEFLKLVKEAELGSVLPEIPEGKAWEVLDSYLSPFDGIALHRERVIAKKEQAITFIRYQAMQFNGLWDTQELENLAYYFKRVDLV